MTENLNRYSLLMEAYTELGPQIEQARQTKPMPAQPTLGQVLADF